MSQPTKISDESRPAWLRDAPKHWTVAPLKTKTQVRNGATPASGEPVFWDGEIPWATPVDLGNAGAREIQATGRSITKAGYESCGTTLVPAGSVIVSTRAPIGSLAIAGVPMCFNQGCRGVVPTDEVSGRFLYYALSAFTDVLQVLGEGTTFKELSSSSLSDLRLPWPTMSEQLAIASYLDAETKRIDGLIAEKKKLLALLEEARFAAVERAIRPSLEFRAQPLRRFVEALSTGPFGSALHSSDYIAGGISVINPTHIINGQVVPDNEVSIAEEMAEALCAYRLKPNDIVVGRRGEMGRCAVVPPGADDWLCGTGCLMCTPDASKVLPEYLQLVISSRASREWLSLESVGTTMENLNTEILGRLPCFVPTIKEQQERLRESSREIAGLASLKAHVDLEMNLLQELRTSTITDAVLGRIDVRPT